MENEMTFSECVETLWAMSGSVEENAVKLQNQTGFDKNKLLDPEQYLTRDEQFRFGVARQTPKAVWDQYAADGYTVHEAIDSELSYQQFPVPAL